MRDLYRGVAEMHAHVECWWQSTYLDNMLSRGCTYHKSICMLLNLLSGPDNFLSGVLFVS